MLVPYNLLFSDCDVPCLTLVHFGVFDMRKGLGVMPQAPACPNCESGTLWLTADPDTPFQSKSWVCSNAPDCGYIAEDYNGSPLASFDCPRCARPLQLIRSLKRTKWRCSGWFQEDECTAIFEDRGGVPVCGHPRNKLTTIRPRRMDRSSLG